MKKILVMDDEIVVVCINVNIVYIYIYYMVEKGVFYLIKNY